MSLTENDIREAIYQARKADVHHPEFRMSPWTWCDVQRMKDDNGRFLWESPMLNGEKERLMGYPVKIDRNMPDGEVRLEDERFSHKIGN